MNRFSIRVRLTLWYAASFAVLLIAFCFLIDALLCQRLQARTDFELEEEMHELVHELQLAPNEEDRQRELEARFGKHMSFEFQVYSDSGRCVFASEKAAAAPFPRPTAVSDVAETIETAELPVLGHVRIASRAVETSDGRLVAQVAIPLARNLAEIRELRQIFFLIGPAMLLIASLGGYRLARRSLEPVDRMTRAAARISASQLEERLAVSNPNDELGRLANTLNAMIDRLEQSLNKLRSFTADAAHEFRTPLCVIRNAAEVALMSPRTGDYYEKSLNGILEETARLTALSNQLLLLAREDAGLDPQNDARLDWSQLVQSILDDIEPLFEEHQLSIEHGVWAPVTVEGDAERLRRVLLNVFDNAIKYTPPGGRIAVDLKTAHRAAVLTISDTGIGIRPDDLPRAFERFYRSDASRTRESGGSGLGLAICRAIVERHQGTIEIVSRLGEGTTVRIELPAVDCETARRSRDSAVVSTG